MQNGKPGKMNLYNNIYKDKKVLITGDTGFKGSWLAKWLLNLGAEVRGYSLRPNTNPSHFDLLKMDYKTIFNNINDLECVLKSLNEYKPDIIFHLAAQPLVRYSYENPIETYKTNVIGTANILDAARINKKVKAIIIVTTDKCYENLEQSEGYRETDRMGGYDPYSSSKGAAELVTSSYRNSFFNLDNYGVDHETLIATARAGNVIGGGDWSLDRLMPDLIRGANNNKKSIVRNPNSTRPWQHVLEPISGYLLLGQRLLEKKKEFASAWNFGPDEKNNLTVNNVLEIAQKQWNLITYEIIENANNPHEANLLSLNINKAKKELGWLPIWTNEEAVAKTILWYKNYYENQVLNTELDLKSYINRIQY